MKKLNICAVLFLMTFALTANAQLRGLSYTLAPTGEYAQFGDKSGLKDGFLVGGQLGFGFGQNITLAANYQQGLGLSTDTEKFENFQSSALTETDVDFVRYGGEIKLSLSQTPVRPFIALGTGIQDLKVDGAEKFSQIYTNLGAGLKFTAFRRYTLGLQANASYFKMNPNEVFLSKKVGESELHNAYSLRASLLFNLGGRDPKKMTDLDVAYWENFSNGFRGISLPIEPTVMKIDFSENLNYRNQWFAGLATGLDFGPMVGIRGYYLRGVEPGVESIEDIDEIQIFGGEAKFKLNEGKGIVPFLTLGGGYIDPLEGYVASRKQEGTGFASLGGGIDIPFSKNFKISGFVKTLLNSDKEINEDDISGSIPSPTEISNSLAYGASINFIIGGNKSNAKKVQQAKVDAALSAQEIEYQNEVTAIKKDYIAKIDALNAQIEEAKAANDASKVEELENKKESAEKVLENIEEEEDTLEKIEEKKIEENIETRRDEDKPTYEEDKSAFRDERPRPAHHQGSYIQMTPAEFQLLLRDILDARGQQSYVPVAPQFYPAPAPQLNKSIDHSSRIKNNEYIENIVVKYDNEIRRDTKNAQNQLERKYKNLQNDYRKLQQKLNQVEREQKNNKYLQDRINEIERDLNRLKKEE